MIDPNKLCLGCMNELEEGNKTCKICGWNSEADENKPHQLKCGTVLQGKYLVGKVLGEGGFGITYLGYNLILQEKVAIKEFYPHGFVARDTTINSIVMSYVGQESFTEKSKEGFIREARTMQSLNKVEGIVEMKDVFAENNTVYIVMEYVEGQTLKEYVKENGNKLPMSTVLKLLEPVMDALEKIHAYNLIHRDISPDNIMVGPDGRVTLLDLGAARQISADGGHSLTVNVKHGYAPMEQYQTHGEQGPWTDIYALCATIYRLITGKVAPSAVDRTLDDSLIRPIALGADITEKQERVLLKGLSVRTSGRYLNMFELKNAFQDTEKENYTKEKAALEKTFYEEIVSENKTIQKKCEKEKVEAIGEKTESKKINNDKLKKTVIIVILTVLVICIGMFLVVILLNQDIPINGNNQVQEDIFEEKNNSDDKNVFDQENNAGQVFSSEQQYNSANELLKNGNYTEAVRIFAELDDYKDSKEKFSTILKELNEESAKKTIASGEMHTVAIKNDGTVLAVGWNDYGQCDVSAWKNVMAVYAGVYHTLGIKSDGTVVAVGANYDGQCNVSGWTDIVAICASEYHTIGLKSDGTVVAVGSNDHGQCDVSDWTDIVAVSTGYYHTVGLKSDGTVIAAGRNYDEQCDVFGWTDIIAISAGDRNTVGLKADGTVVAVGDNWSGQCEVSDWKDIVAIDVGLGHYGRNQTIGIKADGTVVAAGGNEKGQCNVLDWKDIIAVSAGGYQTAGLKSDGTVVCTFEKWDISDWDNIKISEAKNQTLIDIDNIEDDKDDIDVKTINVTLHTKVKVPIDTILGAKIFSKSGNIPEGTKLTGEWYLNDNNEYVFTMWIEGIVKSEGEYLFSVDYLDETGKNVETKKYLIIVS